MNINDLEEEKEIEFMNERNSSVKVKCEYCHFFVEK